MTSWRYSKSCRTASIRSGRAGGLAGELKAVAEGDVPRGTYLGDAAETREQHPCAAGVIL